jgi:hypothetical protein
MTQTSFFVAAEDRPAAGIPAIHSHLPERDWRV